MSIAVSTGLAKRVVCFGKVRIYKKLGQSLFMIQQHQVHGDQPEFIHYFVGE